MITLEARLDITTADALHARLSQLMQQADEAIVLDASAIEVITTPALQLLLSFARSVASNNRHCEIVEPSKTMQAAIAALGLDEPFQPWMRKTEHA